MFIPHQLFSLIVLRTLSLSPTLFLHLGSSATWICQGLFSKNPILVPTIFFHILLSLSMNWNHLKLCQSGRRGILFFLETLLFHFTSLKKSIFFPLVLFSMSLYNEPSVYKVTPRYLKALLCVILQPSIQKANTDELNDVYSNFLEVISKPY